MARDERPLTKQDIVEIVPHSAAWALGFAQEALLLQAALKPWLVAQVEHIGSTAVPGLSAKPVIDVMAPVSDLASSRGAIAAAQAVGYCYYPYKPDEMHWFCKPSPTVRTHHLHIVIWRSATWHDRLAFRDALRRRPALAQAYESLKRELATKYPNDREGYTQAKAPFIQSVLQAMHAAESTSRLGRP